MRLNTDIAVVTCVGANRFHITKMWYEQIKTQFAHVYAASSIPLDFNITYTVHSDVPLSDKFNYALKLAYDNPLNHQWFLITGDDDFFNDYLFTEYREAMKSNLWIGASSICFLDYFTRKCKILRYGDCGRVVAAGTLIHRSLVEFPMWNYGMNKSIDLTFHNRLVKKGYKPFPVHTEGLITDLKFSNIWPYSFFSSLPESDLGVRNIKVNF